MDLPTQHTYVITLPSAIGGQLQGIDGLHPGSGVAGLLVLADGSVALPSTKAGWLAPGFLNSVSAIVAFVPGVSTAVVYEKSPPPPQVPEPGGLLLLGSGLIGLGGIRRVIKKK